jgi:multisubunit Na+/H+ antiporter MnhE subunit
MSTREASTRGSAAAVRSWALWWLACFLLWLLLTSTVDPVEVLVGTGASLVAATAAAVVRRRLRTDFRPRIRWLRTAWRLPLGIAGDTVTVFAVLAGRLRGRGLPRGALVAVPFRHGGENPTDDARRALATVGVGVTPNTFVVGVDPDRDELLVHQLRPDPESVSRLLGHR